MILSYPLIFFLQDVRQRVNRVEHLRKLAEELAVTDPDPLELQEEKEWRAVLELQAERQQAEHDLQRHLQELRLSDDHGDDGGEGDQLEEDLLSRTDDSSVGTLADPAATASTKGSKVKRFKKKNKDGSLYDRTAQEFIFTIRQRRNHFKRKIYSLEQRLGALQQERMSIDRNRTRCTFDMRAREKQALLFKVEIERMSRYVGGTVTSSALAGSNMQYRTADYRERIQREYEAALTDIATLKYQVITGENRRHAIKAELEAAEEQRQERTARFHEFEAKFQKTFKLLANLTGGAGGGAFGDVHGRLMRQYFDLLRAHVRDLQDQRRRITDMFLRMIRRYLRSAFSKWATGDFQAADSSDRLRFISRGGVMLEQAGEKRLELQGLLREVMSGAATIRQKLGLVQLSRDRRQRLVASTEFKGMEEGVDHLGGLHHKRGLKLLHEGDGYALLNKFDRAKSMVRMCFFYRSD